MTHKCYQKHTSMVAIIRKWKSSGAAGGEELESVTTVTVSEFTVTQG